MYVNSYMNAENDQRVRVSLGGRKKSNVITADFHTANSNGSSCIKVQAEGGKKSIYKIILPLPSEDVEIWIDCVKYVK